MKLDIQLFGGRGASSSRGSNIETYKLKSGEKFTFDRNMRYSTDEKVNGKYIFAGNGKPEDKKFVVESKLKKIRDNVYLYEKCKYKNGQEREYRYDVKNLLGRTGDLY